jgi:hypothetical protein
MQVGGIFSIGREFFEKLGYYDNQLQIWGGENLELSWKVLYKNCINVSIFLHGLSTSLRNY